MALPVILLLIVAYGAVAFRDPNPYQISTNKKDVPVQRSVFYALNPEVEGFYHVDTDHLSSTNVKRVFDVTLEKPMVPSLFNLTTCSIKVTTHAQYEYTLRHLEKDMVVMHAVDKAAKVGEMTFHLLNMRNCKHIQIKEKTIYFGRVAPNRGFFSVIVQPPDIDSCDHSSFCQIDYDYDGRMINKGRFMGYDTIPDDHMPLWSASVSHYGWFKLIKSSKISLYKVELGIRDRPVSPFSSSELFLEYSSTPEYMATCAVVKSNTLQCRRTPEYDDVEYSATVNYYGNTSSVRWHERQLHVQDLADHGLLLVFVNNHARLNRFTMIRLDEHSESETLEVELACDEISCLSRNPTNNPELTHSPLINVIDANDKFCVQLLCVENTRVGWYLKYLIKCIPQKHIKTMLPPQKRNIFKPNIIDNGQFSLSEWAD